MAELKFSSLRFPKDFLGNLTMESTGKSRVNQHRMNELAATSTGTCVHSASPTSHSNFEYAFLSFPLNYVERRRALQMVVVRSLMFAC